MKSQKSIKAIFSGDEILLSDIWALFWNRKFPLIVCVSVFIILGFIQSATKPKVYTASCVLLAEEGGGGGSTEAQTLAGLAGVSIGASTGASVTDLYPIILANRPFLVELSKESINLDDNHKTTLMQYFQKPMKVDAVTRAKSMLFNLPSTIIGWFRSSDKKEDSKEITALPVTNRTDTVNNIDDEDSLIGKRVTNENDFDISNVTGPEIGIASVLKDRIKLEKKGKQVFLSVTMPEARLSAEATKLVLNKLIQYVIRYKTGKQLDNYNFLLARASEANKRYKTNQLRVAGFADNNFGVIYQSIKSKEQQLQNEFSISLNTYNQLATQLEQARIELKKQTPLFTVLEPVYVPLAPDASSGIGTVIIYAVMGVVVGLILILLLIVKQYMNEARNGYSNI